MKTREQIEDEIAAAQVLHDFNKKQLGDGSLLKIWNEMSVEQKRYLTMEIQAEKIAALKWALKEAPDETEVGYLKGEHQIPEHIAVRLGMYHGMHIHDVSANTYRLRNAYAEGNQAEIERLLGALRLYVNGI